MKSEGGDRWEGKAHFKKKGGNKNKGNKQQSTANDVFRGIGFSIHREGPELYLRTIERIGLYVSTEFKMTKILKTEHVLERNLNMVTRTQD